MKSALWKDVIREIRISMGRFISILAIVAIGVAFFAGVKASVPDMKHTADVYFDDFNMQDIQIISTAGLTTKDVEAIKSLEGVSGVLASRSMDVLAKAGTNDIVMKVHSLPGTNLDKDDVNYINQADLIEGRMPEKSGECIIEMDDIRSSSFQIGDTITVSSGTDQDISESLQTKEFKVVGKTLSPLYISFEKGSSNIGSGTINQYMMILEEDFKMDYYTEIGIIIEGAKELDAYDDSYFEVSDKVKDKLETLGVAQSTLRFQEIKQIANEKYQEGLEAYNDNKQKFDDGISEAEQKLTNANAEIVQGKDELNNQRNQFDSSMQEARRLLDDGKASLDNGYKEYEAGKKAFDDALPQMQEQLSQLQGNKAYLEEQISIISSQITAVETALQNPMLTPDEVMQLQQQLARLVQGKETLNTNLQPVNASIDYIDEQLYTTQAKLEESKQSLDDSANEISQKEIAYEDGILQAEQQFAQAEAKLRSGEEELQKGEDELADKKADGEEQLKDAKEKLEKAQSDINNIEEPSWYVLDRHSQYPYMDYGSVADRMDGISKVFPLFFFLVAALVCLTTMTRMVDEQRSAIGTMKALGYGKAAIAFKYVAYAFFASLAGSIIGCMIGMYLFPKVIFDAWALMYTLPEIKFIPQYGLAIGASSIVIGITILAAFSAVYKELVEVPSTLMRPKPPKDGKKIMLERIPFIWNHFSFIQKVTARNIFRYKKRFLMTVIGISGCTALLAAGFGIQDSISDIVSKQYGEVLLYDVSITYKKDATQSSKKAFEEELNKYDQIEEHMNIAQYNGIVKQGSENISVSIEVLDNTSNYRDFIDLHTRSGQKDLPLEDNGVIITEKLSKNLDLSVGDTMIIENGDDVSGEVYITGIMENYVGHSMYISNYYYKEIFKSEPNQGAIVAKTNPEITMDESTLGQTLLDHEGVQSISFFSGIAANFQNMISSLGFVIVVLIVAAGLLAFVVLYNLTNVNISERIREIATIKVLGFYDKEVSAYVYRENIFLTMIGAAAGLLLGIGLHRLIMSLAEMENIMFGRNINTISFILAFIITMLFAIIVNLVMYRKLKNVPMVESLKSVE